MFIHPVLCSKVNKDIEQNMKAMFFRLLVALRFCLKSGF